MAVIVLIAPSMLFVRHDASRYAIVAVVVGVVAAAVRGTYYLAVGHTPIPPYRPERVSKVEALKRCYIRGGMTFEEFDLQMDALIKCKEEDPFLPLFVDALTTPLPPPKPLRSLPPTYREY